MKVAWCGGYRLLALLPLLVGLGLEYLGVDVVSFVRFVGSSLRLYSHGRMGSNCLNDTFCIVD